MSNLVRAGRAIMPLWVGREQQDLSKRQFDNCPPSRIFFLSVTVDDKAPLLLPNFLSCKRLYPPAFEDSAGDKLTGVAKWLHAG